MRAYDKINSYISQVSYYGNQSKIIANITTSQGSVLQKINRYTTSEEHIDTIMDIMDTVDMLMPCEIQGDDGCPSLEYEHTSGWDVNSQTISSYLSQAESLLSQVEQLNNAQNINASLTLQQATLKQELIVINQQIASVQQQIDPIQSAVNSFNISTTINPMSPAQKTHLLQKSWAQNDELSKSIVNLIKEQVFEPHYTNGANISLVETALSRGDMSLFELLIAKGLKFDQISRIGKTFFAIVQESNNDTFIKKMIDTKQDFSNSLASLVTKGEAAKLAKLFDFDPELTKKTYEGHSLLKIAIAKDQYDVAEKILDKNPETSNQVIIKTALAKGKDCNGQKPLLKIMNADGEPETQIKAFKVLFDSGVPVDDIRQDPGDAVFEYPDINQMFHEREIAGDLSMNK